MTENEHNLLLRVVFKSLKYFLLALIGFGFVSLVSMTFGGIQIMNPLLPFVGGLVLRLGIILLCLIATAIIVESLR